MTETDTRHYRAGLIPDHRPALDTEEARLKAQQDAYAKGQATLAASRGPLIKRYPSEGPKRRACRNCRSLTWRQCRGCGTAFCAQHREGHENQCR